MTSIKKILTLIILSLSFSTSALAYTPPYWMIMSRVAENHGKGHYKIEQNVQFDHAGESFYVLERWYIEDEDSFRLEAFGQGQLKDKLRLTFVYKDGRKYFVDSNGVRKSEKIPADFFESYFHFRRSKVIKPRLVAHKIAPPESLKSENHRYSEKNPNRPEESYLRLGRSGGVVTYTIGKPTPVGASEQSPGLWIEQDQFNVRKIRFESGTEVIANAYQKHSRDAWFPGELQVSWNKHSAKINVTRADAIGSTKSVKDLLSPSSLNFGENPKLALVLPDDAIVAEFYRQLR